MVEQVAEAAGRLRRPAAPVIVDTGASAAVRAVTITGGRARSGGGIFLAGGGNSARVRGGGIFNSAAATLALDASLPSGNTAVYGGAMLNPMAPWH